MELTININEGESATDERREAEAVPSPPGDERSIEGLEPPQSAGRRSETSRPGRGETPPASTDVIVVAPPMLFQPGGASTSSAAGSVVSPPTQFGVRHGSRGRR